MCLISFAVLPLSIRYILTPLLLYRINKKSMTWEDEKSRARTLAMRGVLKKRLMSSERMSPAEDLKALVESISPADNEGVIHLDFTALRFLEIMLMAYEDIHRLHEKSRLLRSLLNHRLSWFTPFIHGYKAGRVIQKIKIIRFLNRKAVFPQILRLALIPLFGIPGLLFYSLRSIILRLFWEGVVRSFYLRFLHQASEYLVYLYGGQSLLMEERKLRFSRNEIIRKGRHYDRELSILPEAQGKEEELADMIQCYEAILNRSGLSPDSLFNRRDENQKKRNRFKAKVHGFLRKSIYAVNEEITGSNDSISFKESILSLLQEIPAARYPGKTAAYEVYRPVQFLSAGYKLTMIALGAVYSNAPGSRFALEKLSIELFRKARKISKDPLIALMSQKGLQSWKRINPFLKARQILKFRKLNPAGAASLGLPLMGRMLQDKGREMILYRLGRALIRTSLKDEKVLTEP